MKKLLILLVFPLFLACSADDPDIEEEKVKITEYYLILRAECVGGAAISSFEVSEEVYKNILSSHNIGDCETFFEITALDGEVHSGYLDGEYTTTY